MEEIWKDVKGYEGYYLVSNLGNVKSIDRTTEGVDGSVYHYQGRMLKPSLNQKGYKQVNLTINCVTKGYRIHRLVAEAFIPNPDNLPQVNHKDEDKLNNCVWNLEWCTNEYNHNYGTRNKRQGETLSKTQTGMKYSKSRVKNMSLGQNPRPILQYDLQGNLIKEWNSCFEIEEILGFNRQGIYHQLAGHQKTAYKYVWKYK